MRHLIRSACLALTFISPGAVLAGSAAAMLAGCGGSLPQSTAPAIQSQSARPSGRYTPVATPGGKSIFEIHHWVPKFKALSPGKIDFAALDAQQPGAMTIPFYKGTVKSPLDGNTYSYRIAGADPQQSDSTTDVLYAPIVLRVTFPDGTVLDPTKPGCNDTVSIENRFFKGPNFVPTDLVSNGVDVGVTQINDAFQRAEFWTILKGQNYHTVLKAGAKATVVDVNAPADATTMAGVCNDTAHVSHRVGKIEASEYYRMIDPLINEYSVSTQAAVVFTYNILVSDPSGCCTLGFHGAYQRKKGKGGGLQTFAVGSYFDDGSLFKNYGDIGVLTHELGELLNDPFVHNWTPAWGHVGEVRGCQSNLEVGDPLSGTNFTVIYNGFSYNPQELAFFSWFFRTPSTGTGGLFSFEGTFTSPQGACNT
ncbi:MAG: hypothetical protein WA814_10620 [Candidatus Baltobacteraceae bacterium]